MFNKKGYQQMVSPSQDANTFISQRMMKRMLNEERQTGEEIIHNRFTPHFIENIPNFELFSKFISTLQLIIDSSSSSKKKKIAGKQVKLMRMIMQFALTAEQKQLIMGSINKEFGTVNEKTQEMEDIQQIDTKLLQSILQNVFSFDEEMEKEMEMGMNQEMTQEMEY